MNRINILHVIDKLSMDGVNPSSCAVLLGDWYACLDPDRYRTTVCTLRNPDPAGAYLEARGIKVHYLGYGKISPGNIRGIAELIDADQADIVHLHGYSAANFGRLASRLRKIPNIVHEHAVLKVQPHQYLADWLLRNYTDVAIAVSDYVRDFMIKSRSVPREKIRLIGNGIRLDRFERLDEAAVLEKREAIGIGPEKQIIGTVTRLREEKGNEYLIRAMPDILQQELDAVLLVVGDGPQRQALQQLATQLGVDQEVKFLGFRDDVPALISTFDVQAIPSLTEGFPLCLAEAMAAGSAIVATGVGGMKEIGRDGDTVLFVPPRDPGALSEKIISLLENRELAAGLSQRAVAFSAELGIEKSLEKQKDVYNELAGINRK